MLRKAHGLIEMHLSNLSTLPASPCKEVARAMTTADRMVDDVERFFGCATVTPTQPKPAVEETILYASLPSAHGGLARGDPLLWWKQNQARLPRLASLARVHLAIMASSAPVERVFSASGWIVSKRRCAMTDSTVSLLTFLVVNKHHLPLTE